MNGYNHRDIQKMQQDAEKRIREMQRKADQMVGNDMPPVPNFVRTNQKSQDNRNQNNRSYPKTEQTEKKSTLGATDKSSTSKGLNLLKMFNFSNFKIDKDVMLIVVMILLLSSEEGDELLLLALAYIML